MGEARTGSPETAGAPDRIFISNLVRRVEIGAYQNEVGLRQRLRFDVTVEVAPSPVPIDDDVTRVVNYVDIVDAIDALIAGPRLSLLETFAERLAAACLVDPRTLRAHVRIEKLDRLGGGGLGVEITRARP